MIVDWTWYAIVLFCLLGAHALGFLTGVWRERRRAQLIVMCGECGRLYSRPGGI